MGFAERKRDSYEKKGKVVRGGKGKGVDCRKGGRSLSWREGTGKRGGVLIRKKKK